MEQPETETLTEAAGMLAALRDAVGQAMVKALAKAGADLISFHPDASTHVDRTLQLIKAEGCQAGLVFNPATPVDVLLAAAREQGLGAIAVTDHNEVSGALDAREQDRAISSSPPGRRKVVLATSIAETSLTIEGVRVVIDSGLSRVPRYEPDVGLTRLETVRVSRAAADQRRGRAGRVEPGVCYRLWDEPQTASLEAYTRPEILSADLSSFMLDLAQWGASDPGKLAFLDPPPRGALAEARTLLAELGAIDSDGRITEEGRKLRALPLPPRLARMVVDAAAEGAGELAAGIAAVACR